MTPLPARLRLQPGRPMWDRVAPHRVIAIVPFGNIDPARLACVEAPLGAVFRTNVVASRALAIPRIASNPDRDQLCPQHADLLRRKFIARRD